MSWPREDPKAKKKPDEVNPPPPPPPPKDKEPQFAAFAHGTSIESAGGIVGGGLDAEAASALWLRGQLSPPGAFSTFPLGAPGSPEANLGLNLAYAMGQRQDAQPVVLVMTIPNDLYQGLLATGQARIDNINAKLPQVVFLPPSYPALNAAAQWQIIDPHAGQRGGTPVAPPPVPPPCKK